jgi:ATP-dependent exoDNAse (exonuclease V) beta subunit
MTSTEAKAFSGLVDGEARTRIANDLGSTLVVEAAAGTGKTTALVERILSLLRTGTATLASGKGDLVAVTFTEKAAGEMKLRLRTEIEKARTAAQRDTGDPKRRVEKERLDQALEQLEAAHIGTIHAFCSDILRERPIEARIDPLFEVAAEDEQDRLYEDAFTQWFQTTLARPSSEVPGVSRVLRRATRERDQDGPKASLRKSGRSLVEQRDFPTTYERPPFDRAGSIDAVVLRLAKLVELRPKGFPDSWLTKSLAEIERVLYEIERREESTPRDHDAVEAQLRTLQRSRLWGWKGSGQWYNRAEGIARQDVLDQRDDARKHLDEVLAAADADLAASLHGELSGIVEIYESRKLASGKLDFLDLLLLTRELLAIDESVRAELQGRFSHLLIDEFQDTDPLQAEILFLLAADDPKMRDPDRARVVPGKLFLVGDPKQSIYRFRRADVSLYEGIKRRLQQDGAAVLQLTTSFRSAPSIQELVNAAFAPLMPRAESGDPSVGDQARPEARSQAEYVPLSPHRPDPKDRPTIIALPVPRPYGDFKKIVQWKIEESFPDAVGAFVDWLVRKSGWTITERGSSEPTSIKSQHVCLLFKRLQSFGSDVTRPYVRALEARRIPHVLVGGRSFHEREEVIALRNALAAIEWPDDTFSTYATLHGPFFAIGDDALLAFRHTQRHLHPLRKRDESTLTELTRPVAEALDVLARLHVGRNRSTIADTIARLLEMTRAHAGVAIWPAGEQALGNILRVLDMARRFELGSVTSFRAFVSRLHGDAERGGVNEAPVVEEGTDGVRIMTVHKAKGLEFPVVILVDPTATATFRDPSRYVDPKRKLWAVPLCGASPKELLDRREEILRQDREEAHRLLYVATTRARELLVLPVVGDERDEESDGWLDPLAPVLYPRPEDRRAARTSAPGCPVFGEDTVFERPDNVERDADWSVQPGLHRPAVGNHEVVFWDPKVLELDKEDEAGLRHEKVLANGPAAKESEDRHATWKAARGDALANASTPMLRVRTVTEMKNDAAAPQTPTPAGVTIESTDATRRARPHGKRFGILVHAVLATVALDANDGDIADAARIQGRVAGASEEEVAAARDVVRSALAHPLLVRARSAERVEREVAVMFREDDGTIVEGVVDLAFFENGAGWTVVDFKTDLAMGDRRDAYARQVAVYARAITAATGAPANGALLSV